MVGYQTPLQHMDLVSDFVIQLTYKANIEGIIINYLYNYTFVCT